MVNFTLPATHSVKLLGKKKRIATIYRSTGTRGSYGVNRLSEAVVDGIDNSIWLIIGARIWVNESRVL